MKLPEKAIQPTFYFIGVTTTQSAIMKVFPLWAQALGLKNTVIKGIDIELNADPSVYREVVKFIKDDELSLGALVTTHKLDIYSSAHDLFDYLDPYARAFSELSCISKKDGLLAGSAKDPISSGLTIESFTPPNFWNKHGGDAFLIGSGGSAIAIASYLINLSHGDNIPRKIFVSDLSQERLDHMYSIMKKINQADVTFEYSLIKDASANDSILSRLQPHSLVVNATGLGKDRPGSPLTDSALFPRHSLVWELNYRGDLLFLAQAERQATARQLSVHDGWVYFIHGWTQVIAEVFHMPINQEHVASLSQIARS